MATGIIEFDPDWDQTFKPIWALSKFTIKWSVLANAHHI
jgi:hypothetical protein